MYSCKSFFLYPLIPGISTAHLTTDLSYSCLSLIRFPLCATTISFQTPVFFCTFPQLPLTPGPTAVCLLRLLKYCKYCRVAPVVVAVEESILWINHPDRKGLAGVRKGLGHWTFSRAVETPVPTSKSIHPSIQMYHLEFIFQPWPGLLLSCNLKTLCVVCIQAWRKAGLGAVTKTMML